MIRPNKDETKRRSWWALKHANGALRAEFGVYLNLVCCYLELYNTKKEAAEAIERLEFNNEDPNEKMPIPVKIKIVEV